MNKHLLDKVRGSYFGAAIADAMGGPVETMTYTKIKKLFGRVEELMEYKIPPGHIEISPETYYVKQTNPGTYTDDTRGRNLICQLIIQKGGRITADDFGRFLSERLNPEYWWPAVMLTYWRIKFDGMDPRDAGKNNLPGGGVGWYSPLGILHAGDPYQAYWSAFDISSVLKRGSDRELTAAVAAAVAEAFKPDASVESVVEAAKRYVGEEARSAIEQAVNVAREAKDVEDFYRRAYESCLVEWDARFQNKQDTRRHPEGESSCDLLEQVPIAIACFVLANGDARESIINAVNFGRDADTIATTTGAIAGAFSGAKGLPQDWIETVKAANPDPRVEDQRLNLERLCEGLWEILVSELEQDQARVRELEELDVTREVVA